MWQTTTTTHSSTTDDDDIIYQPCSHQDELDLVSTIIEDLFESSKLLSG